MALRYDHVSAITSKTSQIPIKDRTLVYYVGTLLRTLFEFQ